MSYFEFLKTVFLSQDAKSELEEKLSNEQVLEDFGSGRQLLTNIQKSRLSWLWHMLHGSLRFRVLEGKI